MMPSLNNPNRYPSTMKPILALCVAAMLPQVLLAQDDVPLLMPEEREAVAKQASEFNQAIMPSLAAAAKSTVRIWSGSKRLAYGTVVGDGSKILSKWSEVSRFNGELRVDGTNNEMRPVTVTGIYKDEDLVVLQITGAPLVPVNWSFEAPKLGAFLAASQPDGRMAAFGVVSVLERSLRETDFAYLGITADQTYLGKGVKVSKVDEKSGAASAGLKSGDIIVKVGDRAISGLLALKNALTGSAPGEKIALWVQAEGGDKKVEVTLGNHPKTSQFMGDRLAQMELMGGPVSRVRDSFTHVIQTDMRFNPNQVGGPVVDLKGRILGITMARADRTRSFVMPASAVVNLLKTEPVKPSKLKASQAQLAAGQGRNRPRPQMQPDEGDDEGPSPLEQAERMQRHVGDMQRLLEYMREELQSLEEQGR